MKKYQCPCCGYFTYNVPANEDCGYICPVCFWENDPFIASDNEPSDSNHGITLKEAKFNFSKFGACEKETSVYKGYKQDKIEMRGDRAEMSDFPLYLNTVAGGLDRRDQTIGGFSFVVKIYALPVVEIIG